MAEELQHLLDAIQKEGVEKAEADARQIVSAAKKQAGDIIDRARTEAKEIGEAAERNAADFTERGNRALEQAARDVLISLGRAMESVLRECVLESVGEALTPDTLREILLKMTEDYLDRGGTGRFADMHLSEDDEKALAVFFTDRLHEKVKVGLEIHPSNAISKGFKITFGGQKFHHDFTREAIAEELCRFLQPRLREIVRRAIPDEEGKR
ncbi:MAG TPA: hypothetical protein VM492_17000 [Sumerlaeia bacterium]|nr:hypothetical protein [Sumerlaeia bacterium]